jgi:hypothetical protein
MDYTTAFKFAFQNPNWIRNVLLAAICALVPVAGAIVLAGYIFEIVEALHKRGKNPPAAGEEPYPSFDLNRVMDYFMRGIPPLVVGLIFYVVTSIVIGIVYGIGLIVMAMAAKMGGAVVAIVMLFMLLVIFMVAVVSAVLQLPLVLRAGLSRDIGSSFSVPFLKDFLNKIGKETVISQIVLGLAAMIGVGVGFMLCLVPGFVASGVIPYAFAHIDYQLYTLYLGKGGEQIPIKPAPLPAT